MTPQPDHEELACDAADELIGMRRRPWRAFRIKPPTHRQPFSEPSARIEPFDDQILSDLIGDVYDATLDQVLWPDVLERAAQFVGGIGATLFSKDAAAQLGDIHYAVGIDQHYKQLYLDKYVTLDPATTGQFFAEVEEPVATGNRAGVAATAVDSIRWWVWHLAGHLVLRLVDAQPSFAIYIKRQILLSVGSQNPRKQRADQELSEAALRLDRRRLLPPV